MDAESVKANHICSDSISSTNIIVTNITNPSGSNINSIGVPVGAIIMWSGATSDIGNSSTDLWNYELCDGSALPFFATDQDGNTYAKVYSGSNSPSLKDRFIVASGGTYTTGQAAGQDSITLNKNQLPTHLHSVSVQSSGNTGQGGAHTHDARKMEGVGTANGVLEWTSKKANASRTGPSDSETINPAPDHVHAIVDLPGSGSTDGGTGLSNLPIENRPKYYALAFIMRIV